MRTPRRALGGPGAAVTAHAGFNQTVRFPHSFFHCLQIRLGGVQRHEEAGFPPERLRGLGHVEVAVLTEVEDVAVVLAGDEGGGHYCCSETENSRGAVVELRMGNPLHQTIQWL